MTETSRKQRGTGLRAGLGRLFLVIALAAIPAWAQNQLILATTSSDDLPRLASQYNLTVVRTVAGPNGSVYLVSPNDGPPANLSQLKTDPAVVELESDREVGVHDPPSHAPATPALSKSLAGYLANAAPLSYYGALVRSGYVNQPASAIIQMAQAHSSYPLGSGIVAVIDTGVDPTHPVLANSLVPGYDFIHNRAGYASELGDVSQSTVAILDQSTVAILDSKNWPLVLNQSTVAILDQSTVAILDGNHLPKDFGHGTMVSGLIHLVAPQAMIMPLKAFSADGTGMLSDVIRAIYYAADHGAAVINMSFSFSDPSPNLERAIQYAESKGVICVAAVGNSGRETTVYPAAFRRVIGVASTSDTDQLSAFSNRGDMARLGAPGEGVITLYPGGNYAAVWGTSFSAPLVSGAASLVLGVRSGLTYSDAMDALRHGPEVGDLDARLDLIEALAACTHPSQSSAGGGE